MSWLFSRALVAEFSAATCSDGEPSALSSTERLPLAFCAPDKMTVYSGLSRSGMMFAPLTADRGAGVLTSYLAAFPARPIPRQLREGTLRTISGRKCDGSWQMSLPGTYLPRMSSGEPSSAPPTTSRRWATASDACGFPRQTWAQTTFGSGTGFVHTPTCTANYAAPSMRKWPNCREFVRVFGKPSPANHEWLMGWPIGWSDLRPLETDKFRQWQQQHGAPSVMRSELAAA